MGPISKKIIDALKKAKKQKIIDFKELKEAKSYAQDLDKTVVSEDALSKHTILSMQFMSMHKTRFKIDSLIYF